MEALVATLGLIAVTAGSVTLVTSGLLLVTAATRAADRSTGWIVCGPSTDVPERHRRGFGALRNHVRGHRLEIAEFQRWARDGWRASRRSLLLTGPPTCLGIVAALAATVCVPLATDLPEWHASWIPFYLTVYVIGWGALALAVTALLHLPAIRLPFEWSAGIALVEALVAIERQGPGDAHLASGTARRLRELERAARRTLRRRFGSDHQLPESTTSRRLARSAQRLSAWAAGQTAVTSREAIGLCWDLSCVWRDDRPSGAGKRTVNVHWPSRRFPFRWTTGLAAIGPFVLLIAEIVSRLIASL